jgi:hypothetical protein
VDFTFNKASLNGMLKEHLKKISLLKDRVKLKGKTGWEELSGVYNIRDERINIVSMNAKEGAYHATGKGYLSFKEYADIYMDFYMPFNNLPYEAIKLPSGEVMLPLHVIGPMLKPRLDFPYTAKYITKRTVEHETAKVKAAAKKAADKEVKKVTEKAKEGLKKIFKGFKF